MEAKIGHEEEQARLRRARGLQTSDAQCRVQGMTDETHPWEASAEVPEQAKDQNQAQSQQGGLAQGSAVRCSTEQSHILLRVLKGISVSSNKGLEPSLGPECV